MDKQSEPQSRDGGGYLLWVGFANQTFPLDRMMLNSCLCKQLKYNACETPEPPFMLKIPSLGPPTLSTVIFYVSYNYFFVQVPQVQNRGMSYARSARVSESKTQQIPKGHNKVHTGCTFLMCSEGGSPKVTTINPKRPSLLADAISSRVLGGYS